VIRNGDVVGLGWHTDQLHRAGAGLVPDLDRGRIATTLAVLRRNGRTSFAPKRGLWTNPYSPQISTVRSR
jgi:hypothetical protein